MKLIGSKIKVIAITCLLLIFIFLLSRTLTSIDGFISWIENLYYIKILILGLAFIKGKDLWQVKGTKFEKGNDIIYKPKLWVKSLNIIAGIAITIYLVFEINNNKNSNISYILNLFLIVAFLLFPITFYFIYLKKNWSNYILLNTSEINIKSQNSLQKFRYVDIKSAKKTDVIELLLNDGSNYILDNSLYIGYHDQLLALIKKNLNVLVNNETNTINQSSYLNESIEFESNNYFLCFDYPEIEIDIVVFALNQEQKVISDQYLIFFHNPFSPEYSIENMADKTINDSDESIKIELPRLPNSCATIKIFAVKYSNECIEDSLNLGENVHIKIYDSKDNKRVTDYKIPFYLDKGNSIELLVLCKRNDVWGINPSGKQTEQDLQALVDIYF
jgi:stress response protein SCP2